jgi:serine protease Do
MLGTTVQDLTPPLAKQFRLEQPKGALVAQVNPESPAQKAGILSGDVIVKFAGKPIDDSRQLRALVSRASPGTSEEIQLVRNGKTQNVTVKLGSLQTETAQAKTGPGLGGPEEKDPLAKFGAHTETLNPQIAKELQLKEQKGLIVAEVEAASPAGMAGLRPGDVISEVDRQKVDSTSKADQVVSQSKNPDEVLLLVKRDGNSLYVTLETGTG